jgi:hypothetical protein
MSLQQSYSNPAIGMPGQLVGINNASHDIGSYINDLGSAKQIHDVTITAADSTAYLFTINGIPVTYTSDASATVAEIRDGLIEAGRATLALQDVVVFQPFGSLLRIIAATAGTGFTYADSDSNLSGSATVANVAQTPIKFGRAVVKRTGSGTTDQSVRLPFAPTAQVTTVTVTAATNSKVYSFIILTGGYSYQIDYTSDGSATTAEISAGLTARVNALNIPITAADTTDEFTLTADVPGTPFTVAEVDSELTVAETTANVPLLFVGVAARHHNVVSTTDAAEGQVAPLKAFSVIESGHVYVEVEEAVAWGDDAYFRHTATGTEEVGTWRNDADGTDCEQVIGAKFRSSTSGAGIAVLELP